MKYEISHSTKRNLKIALIWNAIALVLNFIIIPVYNYNNGYTFGEAMFALVFMIVLSVPVLIVDYILYKKILNEATKKLIVIALVMSILSVLLLVKLPSILMVVVYIRVLMKDKVE